MPAVILLGNGGGSSLNGGADLVFQNDFTAGSLVGVRGPALTNTRATASTTTDHELLVRNILAGEARFHKLRRVEQLVLNSGWLGGVPPTSWTHILSGGTITAVDSTASGHKALNFSVNNARDHVGQSVTLVAGRKYRFSVYVESLSGTLTNAIAAGINGSGTLDGTGPIGAAAVNAGRVGRYVGAVVTCTASGTVSFRAGLGVSGTETNNVTVRLSRPLVEDVTGQAIQEPSEYVSTGVLSAPWHGAGVDAVKYFNTANGNTVASNVVTEATGAPLTLTAAGLWVNEAATNIILQSEDHSVTWGDLGTPTRTGANKAVGSVVLDLLGDDDGITSAEAKNQTITFTGDAQKSVTVYVAQGTSTSSVIRLRDTTALADRLLAAITWSGGVPTVTMTTGTQEGTPEQFKTNDGGTAWRIKLLTTSVTAANTNSLEFYPATDAVLMTTSTGNVNVGGWMVRNATVSAPYVKTTTASVTVSTDAVSASASGLFADALTMYAAFHPPLGASPWLFSINDGTQNEEFRLSGATAPNASFVVTDGGVVQASIATTGLADARNRVAAAAVADDFASSQNGGAVGTDASGTLPTVTTITVGGRPGTASNKWNSVIGEVRIYNVRKSNAELQALSTP